MRKKISLVSILGLMVVFLLPLSIVLAVDNQQATTISYEFTDHKSSLGLTLGIDPAQISINRKLDGDCTITFDLPIRTERNQTFSSNGSLLSETIVDHNELQEWQLDALKLYMGAVGCGELIR